MAANGDLANLAMGHTRSISESDSISQGSLANAVMTYLRDTNPRVSLRGTTPSLLLLAGDRRAKDPVEAIIALCESAAAERVGGVGRYRQVVQ